MRISRRRYLYLLNSVLAGLTLAGPGRAAAQPISETETGTWQPMPGNPPGQGAHTATWTGTELLVWGGMAGQGRGANWTARGAAYDPAVNRWTPLPDAPLRGREGHAAVWSGTELLVWGGGSGSRVYGDGAAYNPTTGGWRRLAETDAPSPRSRPVAVWTGSAMLVWGGHDERGAPLSDDGAYDPVADRWRPLVGGGAVDAGETAAAWTGRELLVWSGGGPSGAAPSGAAYDPGADTWRSLASPDAPIKRVTHLAAWTGDELLLWGGRDLTTGTRLADGDRYDPVADRWTPIAAAPNLPLDDAYDYAVAWGGHELLVWGSYSPAVSPPPPVGARYNPARNEWRPMSAEGAPPPSRSFTATWTGTDLLIWGGFVGGTRSTGTGGRYVPPPVRPGALPATGEPGGESAILAVTGLLLLLGGLAVRGISQRRPAAP